MADSQLAEPRSSVAACLVEQRLQFIAVVRVQSAGAGERIVPMSIREIAGTFGHSPKIRQVRKNPQPQPYTRTRRPTGRKLTDALQRRIDAILRKDESAPPKQRRTAVASEQSVGSRIAFMTVGLGNRRYRMANC